MMNTFYIVGESAQRGLFVELLEFEADESSHNQFK